MVKYSYDAYGNVFISGTVSSTIGELNPYRYRGYYYDEETSLFWLSSRYYSPELCRFISPDDVKYLDPESVNGLNLYCYCLNNPISYADPSGNFPVIASIIGGIAVAAVVSVIVVLVVKNCISENAEKEKTPNDLADAIMSNIDPQVLVDLTNGFITNDIGNYPANSLPIQPHGEGGYEIPNDDYSSYSGGRAVFDSTYEEDLFDVILSLQIWG